MKKKSIWVEDLNVAERIWHICYMNKGWDVYKELDVRFSWWEFKYMYNFVVIEKPFCVE